MKQYEYFSDWLKDKMSIHQTLVYSMAKKLRVSPKVIYRNCSGETLPRFSTVIAYCWYFGDGDDPEEVWELVEDNRIEREDGK